MPDYLAIQKNEEQRIILRPRGELYIVNLLACVLLHTKVEVLRVFEKPMRC